MKPCSSWHKPSAKEREGTPWKSCISRGNKRCCQSLLQMRPKGAKLAFSKEKEKNRRCCYLRCQWGIHALSTSNHHDNAAATSFWCAELHGWTCQSQELNSGKTAARPWVPPLLQLVCRRGGCTPSSAWLWNDEDGRSPLLLYSLKYKAEIEILKEVVSTANFLPTIVRISHL